MNELQPAYLLHRRAYRSTSFLVKILTRDHGLIHAVARGARQQKKKQHTPLQLFTPLLLNWRGRSELVNLQRIEGNGLTFPLKNTALLSAFYLNEVLVKLLEPQAIVPIIYRSYIESLQALSFEKNSESMILRKFEMNLLHDLGYTLILDKTSEGESIVSSQYYSFIDNQGFVPSRLQQAGNNLYHGQNLLALAAEQWTPDVLYDAKRLLRGCIASLLGGRRLKSRELFLQIEPAES